MYNKIMSDTKIKFVFNETYYYGGKRYDAGDTMDIAKKDLAHWENVSFGNIYKPKGKKDKK